MFSLKSNYQKESYSGRSLRTMEAETEALAVSTSSASSSTNSSTTPFCKDVPNLLSSFIDTFVDFSVSGFFLLPNQPSPSPSHLQTRIPSPDRLIALGDVHGDLEKTRQALRLANLIDGNDKWIGGTATLVQVGDVLDRGGQEIKILYFLEKLRREAARVGGSIITMNGNHEIMNVEGDFRYVTKEGLDEFNVWAHWFSMGNRMKALCSALQIPEDPFRGVPFSFRGVNDEFLQGFRSRIAALRPNGPISSRFFSQNLTVVVVGDSVFVHGGLLAHHVAYGLDRINEEVRNWIDGTRGTRLSPDYCRGRNAVVWLRTFSDELPANCDCSTLNHLLSTIPGAKRLIMGHTIQESGINGVCDNQAIRIDVGMSKGCSNGLPEVLEINSGTHVRILTSHPPLHPSTANFYGNQQDLTGRPPTPNPVQAVKA